MSYKICKDIREIIIKPINNDFSLGMYIYKRIV